MGKEAITPPTTRVGGASNDPPGFSQRPRVVEGSSGKVGNGHSRPSELPAAACGDPLQQ